MLEICLVFQKSEPQYAYKPCTYKKQTCIDKYWQTLFMGPFKEIFLNQSAIAKLIRLWNANLIEQFSLIIYVLYILLSDIDECALNDDGCDTNADCANIDSSYTCTCKTGWTGDGFTCTGMFTVDIMNCLNTLASV